MITHKNWSLDELLMGVETPIPPNTIYAAAPEGAPPRRIRTVEIKIFRFSWSGCEPDRFICVFPEQFFLFPGLLGQFMIFSWLGKVEERRRIHHLFLVLTNLSDVGENWILLSVSGSARSLTSAG